MVEKRAVTLSREELYELVWSKPMIHAAAEFGISGNGLAKVCKRLDVPYPPRGYWAKLNAGQKPKKASLPSVKPKTPQAATITPTPPPPPPPPDPLGDAIRAATDIPEISVSEQLRRPHPIVGAWLDDDKRRRREARTDAWSWYKTPTDLGKRKWRIEDALFKALEKRVMKSRTSTVGYTMCGSLSQMNASTIRSMNECAIDGNN